MLDLIPFRFRYTFEVIYSEKACFRKIYYTEINF